MSKVFITNFRVGMQGSLSEVATQIVSEAGFNNTYTIRFIGAVHATALRLSGQSALVGEPPIGLLTQSRRISTPFRGSWQALLF